MEQSKKKRWIKRLLILALFIVAFCVGAAAFIPAQKNVMVRRDRGVRGIALTNDSQTTAYIYVTKKELEWFRKTQDFWVTPPESEDDVGYPEYGGKLLQINEIPVTEKELSEKFGNLALLRKIIPEEEFYELQITFDYFKPDNSKEMADLYWEKQGSKEYAYCRVVCKGASAGSVYDHVWGRYSNVSGYFEP